MEQLPFSSRRNIFPLSLFSTSPFFPPPSPYFFFSPPLLDLAFETGSGYLTPLESVVWQTGIELGSKRALHRARCENTWVSLMPLRTSPASVEITATLSLLPAPALPSKIKKEIEMLALFFVKKQVVGRRCRRGWRTSPHQRTKILRREGFDCSTYICNSFSQAQGKLRVFQQLGEKSFKVQSAVLKRICAGLWGRLILLPALGSSLQCAFSKAKILACFSVTPYKITNTQSKENNF